MEYLALPFLLQKGYLTRVSLEESIAHTIGLIITTRLGTMKFDGDFGCGIWDREFTDLYTANKADIRSGLRNAIDKYEGRLYNVSISFENVTGSHKHVLGMAVEISGNYRDDGQERKFKAQYFLE